MHVFVSKWRHYEAVINYLRYKPALYQSFNSGESCPEFCQELVYFSSSSIIFPTSTTSEAHVLPSFSIKSQMKQWCTSLWHSPHHPPPLLISILVWHGHVCPFIHLGGRSAAAATFVSSYKPSTSSWLSDSSQPSTLLGQQSSPVVGRRGTEWSADSIC